MKVFTQSAGLRKMNRLKEKFTRALEHLEADIATASVHEMSSFLENYFENGVTKETVMNLDWRVWYYGGSDYFSRIRDFFAKQVGVFEYGNHRCGYAKKAVRQVSLGVGFLKSESFFNQLGIMDFLPLIKADDRNRKIVLVVNDSIGSVDMWIDFTDSTKVLFKTKTYQPGGAKVEEQVFPNILAALHYVYENVRSNDIVAGYRSADARRLAKYTDTQATVSGFVEPASADVQVANVPVAPAVEVPQPVVSAPAPAVEPVAVAGVVYADPSATIPPPPWPASRGAVAPAVVAAPPGPPPAVAPTQVEPPAANGFTTTIQEPWVETKDGKELTLTEFLKTLTPAVPSSALSS